ncbi:MAG: aldo/keto reductase, partial [Ilumatobacteraceae bacterium]
PACEANGLGLLPWSPLGGGWLTGKYKREETPTGATRLGENPERGVEAYSRRSPQQRTWDVIDAVGAVADDRGVSMAQVALAWVAQRPGVSSVILGARTTQQLDDNLAAAGLRLSDDEMARLDTASDPAPADYPYGTPGIDQRSRRIDSRRD